MTNPNGYNRLSTLVLYVFGFFLLWEWIRPVEQLTDTSNAWVFILFLVMALMLDFFSIHWIVRFVLNSGFILLTLYFLYYSETYGPFQSFSIMIEEFFYNFSVMIQRVWPELTDMFRSFLFFILLWLMTYLIQYWLINRRQIFLFFLMTLIYITVLDTYTPYAADGAIVRTVISGFAVMGMLAFYRQLEKEGIKKGKSFTRKWMLPLTAFIIASAGIGFVAPKADPLWPDPVPYFTSFNERSGVNDKSGIRKIGYGEDDSSLGGPFLPDNQVVMQAEMEHRHYWKVETKDIYTGKGWISTPDDEESIPFGVGDSVPIESFVDNENIETTEHMSTVRVFMDYPHIVYPLGVNRVEGDSQFSFELNPVLERIQKFQGGNKVFLPEYEVYYDRPRYSVTALSAANNEEHGLDKEFYDRYTQLPDDLPQRVRDLAAEIVEGSDSWFDQIREIERYFSNQGYIYDQVNVAIPAEDDDYVDQFLFETQRGYCDNFSTSMIVLARSAGIPTRWVKGYTEGERIEGNSTYEVTNNNAHSWVEAYFPEVGWVSFEPTRGFTNSVQYNFDLASDDDNQTQEQTPTEPKKPELEDPSNTSAKGNEFTLEKVWNQAKEIASKYWKVSLGVLLIIIVLIALLYYKRGKWLPYVYVVWYKRSNDDKQFVKAYLTLLEELDRYGLPRGEGQTLREYAKVIDHTFSTRDMSRLTAKYEQYLYRGSLEKGTWSDMRKLWENLIKSTIA
ncbi:transglutaminase domain-containing protein [Cytobacillus purgationiresistens]|uniref:Transglutaminase-like putative cysteine protease n=1 Tax=Cytobacillus purgationiresistens TaxID=863449 RepID=A0ABU0APT7_9BACI|nr:transglutaminase domain-containing protein [Cytobacillus purgationiresistens]MDQ0273301.1 transglutaminase-like putative cysteine protease [Cytobacillus purgationiresistens]